MKNFITALAMAFACIITIHITSCKQEKQCPGTCQNGGTCNTGTGICSCPNGYSGTTCQTAANALFLGNYTGNLNCSGTVSPGYVVTISAGNGPLSISVYADYKYNATVSGTNLTIPHQSFSDGSTWTGSGQINSTGGLVTLLLNETDSTGASFSCSFSGLKQ